MKTGKWHNGDEKPKKTGWYVRDYRAVKGRDLPPFSIDHFISVTDGQFWYVLDDSYTNQPTLTDAGFESLPWCKIKEGR